MLRASGRGEQPGEGLSLGGFVEGAKPALTSAPAAASRSPSDRPLGPQGLSLQDHLDCYHPVAPPTLRDSCRTWLLVRISQVSGPFPSYDPSVSFLVPLHCVLGPVTHSDKTPSFSQAACSAVSPLGAEVPRARVRDFLDQQYLPCYPNLKGIFLEQAFGSLLSHT